MSSPGLWKLDVKTLQGEVFPLEEVDPSDSIAILKAQIATCGSLPDIDLLCRKKGSFRRVSYLLRRRGAGDKVEENWRASEKSKYSSMESIVFSNFLQLFTTFCNFLTRATARKF